MSSQDTYNVISRRYVMFSSHLPLFKTLMISRHMHYLFRTHIFIFKILTIEFQDAFQYFQDTCMFSRCSCFQDTYMNFQDTYNVISGRYVIFSRHLPVFKTLIISRHMHYFFRTHPSIFKIQAIKFQDA